MSLYGQTKYQKTKNYKIWESIPTELKKLSYSRFFKQYKSYLLNTQSVS